MQTRAELSLLTCTLPFGAAESPAMGRSGSGPTDTFFVPNCSGRTGDGDRSWLYEVLHVTPTEVILRPKLKTLARLAVG